MDEAYHRNMTVGAAESGNIDMLKKAVASGVDLNRVHAIPMCASERERYAPIFERGAPEWRASFTFWATPLHLAVYHGHYDMVRWLVAQGIDLNPPGRLFCECNGTQDYLRFSGDLLNSPCWNPLHFAICRGHKAVVRLLLSAGASVETMPQSSKISIESLAIPGFTANLEGALVSIRKTRECASRGVTALHTAAQLGLESLTTYLVQHREMDINQEDSQGWTPIFDAMLSPEAGMIRHVVSLGAEKNLRNHIDNEKPYNTPLGFALRRRLPYAVNEPVKAGVSTWYGKNKKDSFLKHCFMQNWHYPEPLRYCKGSEHLKSEDESQFAASVIHLIEATHAEYQSDSAAVSRGSERRKTNQPKTSQRHKTRGGDRDKIEELLHDTLLKSLSHPVRDPAFLKRIFSPAVPTDAPCLSDVSHTGQTKYNFGFKALSDSASRRLRRSPRVRCQIGRRNLSGPPSYSCSAVPTRQTAGRIRMDITQNTR